MTVAPDLYVRGAATLLASWEEYARASEGAALERLDGVAVAVFPTEPERSVYNNALLERGLGAVARAEAIAAMEAAYAAAGIDRYAAWVHEGDEGMHGELARRGYRVEETTRAMGMLLADRSPASGSAAHVDGAPWADHVAYLGLDGAPAGLLRDADPSAFHVLTARLGGSVVGTAMAFDHAGDSGVFNVGTLERHRRRGIGTALVTRLLEDAAARGNETATLQSTQIAEGVYAAAGFRDLGRILEHVPRPSSPSRSVP